MFFVGIMAENREFEIIKTEAEKRITNTKLNLIQIKSHNIENMQNIKFDSIIIHQELSKLREKLYYLEKIMHSAQYVILNMDLNENMDILEGKKGMVITYGLNQKSTVSVSSITEDIILIALQRNVYNRKNKMIEVGEKKVAVQDGNKKIYEELILFILDIIYGKKDIFE